MNLLDLVAKITLDKSEYEKGLAGLKADVDKKSKSLQTGMLKVTGAGVAALGAFAVASVKTGATFDKSMSQVAATMGLSMEEMQTQIGETETAYGHFEGNLREFAQFMGKNTAFSASQAADALNYMALAGYSVDESMTMLPNVLNLAAAGSMDLARASDVVTDVQTAFGLKMEEMPQLIDEMAKTASSSNTSVAQLGDAFLTVGALAQELNGGFVDLADGTKAPVSGIQELEIALGAMANAGVKGSEAGTHMRNMLMKLSSPTAEGTKQLEAMKVSVFDAEGQMRSLSEIMGDFSEKMSDMTQEEKLQAISDLFNARDLASAKSLLNAVTGEYVKFGDQIYTVDDAYKQFGEDIYDSSKGFEYVKTSWDDIGEKILDAEGAAQKMADTQLDNLSGDITLLKSAFEGFQISLSDKLTPALRKGVQGLTWLIQNFGKIAPIVAGAATAFATFAIAINITSIIRKVAVAMQAFFALLAANPIALIIALIAGLVTAIVLLWKNNEDFRNKVIEIWNNIKEVITQVVQALSEFFSAAWESIKSTAIAAWDVISQYAGVAWEVIQTIWSAVAPYFKAVWDTIAGIFSVVASVFRGDFQGAWDAIKGIVNTWGAYFRRVWEAIKSVFSDASSVGQKIVDGILSGIKGAWETLRSWISSAWNSIKSLFVVDSSDIKMPSGRGHAIGLDYVPSNNYPAMLHRGEAVLTAREAEMWRRNQNNAGGGVTINQYIETKPQSPVEVASATAAYFEQARWAM